MHIQSLKSCALALVAAVFITSTALAADAPAPSGKWRIECSGGHATDAGQVQFRVTADGAPILVTAKVGRGRGEHFVAQDVLEALKGQLPVERFHSEIVGGQTVLLKPHHGEANIVVELVESAVPGIRFHVTAE